MSRLDYRPASAARTLGSGLRNGFDTGKSIGIITKEANNPFYAEVILGAQRYLGEKGYVVYCAASEWNYEKEGELLDSFRSRFFRGAIVAPVLNEEVDLSHLFALQRMRFPFVLLDAVTGLRTNTVSIDSVSAAKIAAEHLLTLGHRHIIHFAGPTYTQHHGRDRIDGFRQAFASSDVRYSDDLIVPAGSSMEDGYRTGLSYFRDIDRSDMPSGVTCFNDRVAIGLLRALAELGLRVPEDVSLVGYDNIENAAFAAVPLTTVHNPKLELGRRSAEVLVNYLEAGERASPSKIVLEAELVIRHSTCRK